MTLIVGIKTKGGVLLAADSLASNGHTKRERADAKYYAYNKRVAIGYTTSYRFGQIASWHVSPGKPKRDDDEFEWAVKTYIPALRAALKDHGWLKTKDGQEEGGSLLLAVRGRLFSVESDLQISEDDYGYMAVGSGAQVAFGALYATREDVTLTPEARSWIAYLAAKDVIPGVGGNWHYVRTVAD